MPENTLPTVQEFYSDPSIRAALNPPDDQDFYGFNPQDYWKPGTVVSLNPDAAFNPLDANGQPKTLKYATPESMKPENIAAIVVAGPRAYQVIYKDGTYSTIMDEEVDRGVVGAYKADPNGTVRNVVDVNGRMTEIEEDSSNSNLFAKIGKEAGRVGDQLAPILIPAAAAIIMAYVTGGMASGLMAANSAVASGTLTAAEAAELSGLGLSTTGLSGTLTAAEAAALTAAGVDITGISVVDAAGNVVTPGSATTTPGTATPTAEGPVTPPTTTAPGELEGSLLTPEQITQLENVSGKSVWEMVTEAGKGLVSDMNLGDWARVAGVALPVISAIFAPSGSQNVTTTSTTDTRPPWIQAGAEESWNKFIDDFYGTSTTSGVQQRITEDTDYLKNLDTQYIGDTKGAVSPYQAQLAKTLADSEAGVGDFTPVSFGFGGKKMTSFVPKTNRQFAQEKLGFGREGATINQGLLDQAYNLNKVHVPNEAANKWSDKLEKLMTLTNTGQSTTTQSGEVPGPSTFSNILMGLNTGANLYNAFNYQPSSTASNYQTEWDALKKKYGIA